VSHLPRDSHGPASPALAMFRKLLSVTFLPGQAAWLNEGRDCTIRITAGLLWAPLTSYTQPKESWGRVAQRRLYDESGTRPDADA